MKIVLTNLSNKLYEPGRLRLNKSAIGTGITEVRSYDFEDIWSTEFYVKNKNILDQPRGLGFWLWKPYIIYRELLSLSDEDILIYCDSGVEIIGTLDPVIEICRTADSVMLFGNGVLKNSAWTKRDCFVLMDCDMPEYWNGLQCDAAIIIIRKNAESMAFVKEWLDYCSDTRIISDAPNTCGKANMQDFVAHREDQSVLSLLAAKYHKSYYRSPSQFGNHYKAAEYRVKGEFNCVSQYQQRQVKYYSVNPYFNSPYFQLFNHHRFRLLTTSEKIANLASKIRSVVKKLIKK